VVNNTETWQIHSFEGELVAEYNNTPAAGTPTKEYGYRNGQLLVLFDNGETDVNQHLRWLVQDHLGSTRMEANLSGSLAGMRRHDDLPFGEEL
jgi:hypothetical protein